MNPETAALLSLGEYDEELQKKIIADIETVITNYINRNTTGLLGVILSDNNPYFERLVLKALKTHLNNASNIY